MPARKPNFITFTGADDRTDVGGMADLSSQYPIEWGILFSPSQQGRSPRFPGGEAQSRFLWSGLDLSAHLCGAHSRNIMEGRNIESPVDLGIFKRIQINTFHPDATRINAFRRDWGPRCIAQATGSTFPKDTSIDWLFDVSGGAGELPESWPPYPGRFVGYAGGIGPENVLKVIDEIAASGPYWIDMETKVRTDEWFDLDLCKQVCEAVYGDQ